MFVAGLDMGTTGCKIAVYNENAVLLKTYYREYLKEKNLGAHEIDFEALRQAVFELLSKAAADYKLGALGVTSFGETFALLDDCDRVLAPSMLYTDPKGQECVKELCKKIPIKYIAETTGAKPHEMYSIYKLMWFKSHRPEIFAAAKYVLLAEDYIVYLLTGVRRIDVSLAARTGAFDIEKKTWATDIFECAGIDRGVMSEPVPTGSVAGKLSDKAKENLHISYDMTVVCGAHDQVAAMIGAGVFEENTAMDGTGTVECIPVILRKKPCNPSFFDKGYSAVPFVSGGFACYALSYTGGAVLKWFRDNLCKEFYEKAQEKGQNIYALLDKETPTDPTDILVLPHFAGAATPYMDPNAKAAFSGVTLETDRAAIYKALMEGTAYEIRLNFESLKDYSEEIKQLRATGGGASSDVWLSIKADILNMEITALECREVGAAGTAALAGKAVGIYDDLKTTTEKMAPVRRVFRPNKARAERYGALYAKYRNLYGALKNL